jgi:pimeloyl-ACP methyl ester carboxylesterase
MPFTDIAGSNMYYLDRGEGIPVVLLHGYLGNAFMWAPQITAFENDFRLIIPDIWGHGNSGNLPDGADNLTVVASQLLALLDTLAIDQFILIGHSVGGMLAGEMTLQAQDRVIAMVLMATHLGYERDLTRKYFLGLISQLEVNAYFSENMVKELQKLFFSLTESEKNSRLKDAFDHEVTSINQERIIHSIVPVGRMIFNRRNLEPEFSGIDPASTLVIYGSDDLVRHPKEAKEMAALIGCQCVEIPDTAHMPNLESPAIVTKTLTDFISQVLRNNPKCGRTER